MKHTLEIGGNSQGNSPALATVLSQVTWGGSPSYPSYEGRNEAAADGGAAAAAGTSAAAGAGSGTGPGTATASPAGTDGAASSTATGGTGTGGTGTGVDNEANIRVLRQNYETLKPWEQAAKSIKDPAQAVQAHTRVQKMYTDGLTMAKALGYTEESFKAAFEDDPVDVLSHLRGESAKANPEAATNERIRKAAEEAAKNATKPISDQLNKQQTEAAMRTYDTEFERLCGDEKIGFGAGTPQEVKDAVYDIMDMMMPESVLNEIKTQGKVSGVQAAFDQAKTVLLKVVNAYNGMTQARATAGAGAGNGNRTLRSGGGTGAVNNAAGKPLTLDDIINDSSVLPGVKAGKY